jgi:hypothetical protein
MLRFLQEHNDKPIEVLTAGAALARGGFVYKDPADDELKVLATGLGDDIVDICKNYDGANAVKDPTEADFEAIAENAQALRVPTLTGERYATSEVTRNYADVGDPMTVTNGKLVKATGAAAYQWVYGGTYSDPTGITMHVVEKVAPATAPASRTVTYNNNTGTGTLADPKSPYFVAKEATVLENTFTPPDYYTFKDFDTAANGSGTNYNPGDKVTIGASNITLYAQWQATYSGIVYDANGGSGEMSDDNLYEVDDVAVVLDNAFTPPSGYVFSKFNTAANGSGTDYAAEDEITIIADNLGSAITLYAIWADDESTFRLEYDKNTGTGTMVDASSPYESAETATVLDCTFTPPTNKIFAKWNTLANGTGADYDPADEIAIAADMKLYAIWDDKWTVTYDANTGTGTMTDANSPYVDDSTVTVLANAFTPPTDKIFDGWNTLANGTGTAYAAADTFTITADVTLYAQWVDSITVTYDANTGTGTMTDPSSPYETASNVTILPCAFIAPSGKVFAGWNTESNESGTWYSPSMVAGEVTTNLTLYAIWHDTYTITYNANTGTGSVYDINNPYPAGATAAILGGSSLTPPTGKYFSDWDGAANGSGTNYAADSVVVVNANLMLYAQWADMLTVTYDANTGTGTTTDPNSPYVLNATVTVVASAFTPPENKIFSAWNTLANGTGTSYAPSDTFSITANTTIYAIWTDA